MNRTKPAVAISMPGSVVRITQNSCSTPREAPCGVAEGDQQAVGDDQDQRDRREPAMQAHELVVAERSARSPAGARSTGRRPASGTCRPGPRGGRRTLRGHRPSTDRRTTPPARPARASSPDRCRSARRPRPRGAGWAHDEGGGAASAPTGSPSTALRRPDPVGPRPSGTLLGGGSHAPIVGQQPGRSLGMASKVDGNGLPVRRS